MHITRRQETVIAKALSTAAQVLKTGKHPPLSDIADMERLLTDKFPGQVELLAIQSAISRAIRAGMPMTPGIGMSLEEIEDWLAKHAEPPPNVVDFSRPDDHLRK